MFSREKKINVSKDVNFSLSLQTTIWEFSLHYSKFSWSLCINSITYFKNMNKDFWVIGSIVDLFYIPVVFLIWYLAWIKVVFLVSARAVFGNKSYLMNVLFFLNDFFPMRLLQHFQLWFKIIMDMGRKSKWFLHSPPS